MKAIVRLSVVALFFVATLLINGCKKGDTGPAGKDGSANVASHTFSVPTWTNNGSVWYNNFPVSELTSGNINSAAVQVYWGTTSGIWTAVPYTYVASTNYFMDFLAQAGNVEIHWTYNGLGVGSDPNTVLGGTVQIKVVVIPPAMIIKNPHVNLNNYQEVKQAFNLKD